MENIFFYGLLLLVCMFVGMSTLMGLGGNRLRSTTPTFWSSPQRAHAMRAAMNSIVWNGFVFLAIVAFFWYVLSV